MATAAVVGQTLTLKASVWGASPTGTVTFKDGGAVVGTASVVPAKGGAGADFSYTFSTAGTHNLTAEYGGDANNTPSTSTSVTLNVGQTGTNTTLTVSPNPSTAGQTTTLTANVTGYLPTGTVTFMDGATVLGTGNVAAGQATLNAIINTAGSHSLTASYGGDTNNTASTSAAVMQTVGKSATTTTLAVEPDSVMSAQAIGPGGTADVGQRYILSATVTGASPSGTVTFMDGTTVLGTATISYGFAMLRYIPSMAGTHNLTAVYGGDANNTSSTSISFVLNVAQSGTSTTLAVSPNPSTAGQTTTLTANVIGYLPTGTVTFMDGATVLGTAALATGTATLNAAFSTVGTHSLTASYAGDSNNATSTSAAVSQTVKAVSSTILSAAPNPSVAGQAVTLTAAVTGATPSGTVTFKDGATVLGTGTIAGGQASLSYTFNAAGAHNLTASYAGDANNVASTSAAVSQTVNIATSSTALAATPNPSTAGQVVILTASVTGALPTGMVTFMDGATVLGTGTITAGSTSLSYTFATAGVHSLSASYAGDANNATSTSTAVAQTVNVAASNTVLSATPNPAVTGQTVALTATVTGAVPTGTVTFMDGATVLGTGTIAAGQATFNATFSTVGTHSLTASYVGDANNATSTSAAVSQTVKAVSSTILSATPNPSVAGQAVTLTAAVTGATPSGTVTFKDGATVLGTGTIAGGQATFSATFNTAGAHNLTASYAGDANNVASTSAAVSQTVNIATSSIALATTPNPSTAGQAVTLTATVTGVSPTGTVTFKDGATVLGTGTIAAGNASLSYTFATAGTHSLSASYSGDANNATSTSTAVSQTVNVAASTTVLSATPNPAAANQIVALSARVTGALPTGTVTFKDGTTVLGTGTLAAGIATLNTSFSALGTHSLTASYAGDANHTASTSAAINVTVGADQITYFHNDVAGTPLAATDAAGNLLWKESYRPYGDPMQPPVAENNIWFTGKPYDKDSGLTYMGARYYDPLIGRFTGIDPVGFDENNLHSFNRYAYANNNPLKYVDPDGKSPLLITINYGTSQAGKYSSVTMVWNNSLIPSVFTSGTVGENGTNIKSGVYDYQYGQHPLTPDPDKTPYPALNLTDGKNRELPATRTDGGGDTAEGINVHRGNNPERHPTSGSDGCHVIPQKDWNDFMKNFSSGDKGKYIYWRVEPLSGAK